VVLVSALAQLVAEKLWIIPGYSLVGAYNIMGAKQVEKETASSAVALPKEKMMFDSSKRFKKICVFCGSSSGKKGVFSNEALNLGRELVSVGIIHSDAIPVRAEEGRIAYFRDRFTGAVSVLKSSFSSAEVFEGRTSTWRPSEENYMVNGFEVRP